MTHLAPIWNYRTLVTPPVARPRADTAPQKGLKAVEAMVMAGNLSEASYGALWAAMARSENQIARLPSTPAGNNLDAIGQIDRLTARVLAALSRSRLPMNAILAIIECSTDAMQTVLTRAIMDGLVERTHVTYRKRPLAQYALTEAGRAKAGVQ